MKKNHHTPIWLMFVFGLFFSTLSGCQNGQNNQGGNPEIRPQIESKTQSETLKVLDPELSSEQNDPIFPVDGHENKPPALPKTAKPVIYLYPEKETEVQVQLDYQGELIADYPEYDESIKGWRVTAYPDGHLINHADQLEYSYLFWEGRDKNPVQWDLSKGFVVKGKDTREFLQKTLSKMGLTPKEYNEFIVYWYPLMKDNKYNLIHFAGSQYTKNAPLTITPEPDSLLRVFMVFKALDEEIQVKEQVIEPFERKGFTVVEWGGTEVN